MKNLKRIFAVVLCLTMLLTFSPAVFAEDISIDKLSATLTEKTPAEPTEPAKISVWTRIGFFFENLFEAISSPFVRLWNWLRYLFGI